MVSGKNLAPSDLVGKLITIKIMRYDPEKDKQPYYQTFQLTLERGMTVLDALMQLKATQDNTLAFRKSCRMGICGSCAMYINELPRLACQTQITELNSSQVVIASLPNFPIIRDVVPDLFLLFDKHQQVKPYIIRKDTQELIHPTGEFLQTPEELERYLQFSYCVKCGACISACPTSSTSTTFIGSQAAAQAYRYLADTRDDGFQQRLEILDSPHGLWHCHFPGACSEACPKGVDPAFAIQLLKREIISRRFGFKKPTEPAKLAPKVTSAKRRPDIPMPPEPTIKR
ncbi:MAG: succinate dehydrogenase iron-sulfur subunit [Candidatus Sumerlaeia bacterium]|nr:succinate dehydrogenase iron-sulfur subunit [Candidatus Sumerlaeia bacterium]